MTRKSLLAVWRDAVRDSELDRTAKLVAHTLSTYLNGNGHGFPSQRTLAAGASLSDRAIYKATVSLERAGFLEVEWSRGRSSHRYVATLPATANAVRRSEWSTANPASANPERDAPNPERRSHESVESAESGALSRDRRFESAVALRVEDWCLACDSMTPHLHVDGDWRCERCPVSEESPT